MSAKDCPHDSFAWDSWYHCMACEEQRQQQEKDAEWNAAIDKVLEVTAPRFGITWDVTELIKTLKREVKP